MNNLRRVKLGSFFTQSVAGEWGSEPTGIDDVTVYRAADFSKDCKLNVTEGALRSVPKSKLSNRKLNRNDILVEKSGGSPTQPVGRAVIYKPESDEQVATCSNFLQRLVVDEEYSPEFVYYLMLGLYQANATLPYQQQTTGIYNLKLEEYLQIEVDTYVDRNLQEKVADILSTIDNQIDATQALIDKYTAIKQGMMADLFSRGIDSETKALRPTFEEAPELYHKTPLGILPKEWNVKTLGDISEKITSGSRDWAKFYSSEGDLFVRISNLTREHVNFRWHSVKYVNIGGGSEGERTQLQPGDILVSITADLGIVGVVPGDMGRAYINQHTALIRLSTDGENARFIGNYLSSRRGQEQFEKNNDSGAKAGINLPTIASLRCPIPEEKEQILIASKIDALDEVIADLKREKSKSISLKQGLMQDLLTGKVPVPA